MKKIYSMISVIALVFFPVLLNAQEIDLTGDWEMTTESPRGERTQTIHIEQDGEKLTITMQGGMGRRGGQGGGGEITAEGLIKGNKVEWSFTRNTPRGDFTTKYTGAVEGNTMSGEVDRGERGTAPWSAKRK
ncbi:MAG: hypothetical protein JSV17_11680 [Candidatus Aminicenantes bacterium]|nr:MAG: hypothetical protein JSV17_11680 [Candidatus Aminicenantes bacterium]